MAQSENPAYQISDRQMIAETDDLRVQILTLAAGEEIPWHYHTGVTDTFICLDGPMRVATREPDECHELAPGEVFELPPQIAHRVTGKDGGGCRFAIVQGVAPYDYIPV